MQQKESVVDADMLHEDPLQGVGSEASRWPSTNNSSRASLSFRGGQPGPHLLPSGDHPGGQRLPQNSPGVGVHLSWTSFAQFYFFCFPLAPQTPSQLLLLENSACNKKTLGSLGEGAPPQYLLRNTWRGTSRRKSHSERTGWPGLRFSLWGVPVRGLQTLWEPRQGLKGAHSPNTA